MKRQSNDSTGSLELDVDSSGGGGGGDVNITEVGGAAISLGQKTMAGSFPVVIASDQSAIPVTGTVSVNEPVTVDAVNLDIRDLAFASDKVDVSGSTVAITAATLPLPTGAATLAEQQTQTTALQIIDDWDESDRAKVNPIVGSAGISGNAGTVDAATTRVAIATNANAVTAVGTVADDSPTPGNPITVGGIAKSPDGTTPGAVAEDDTARFTTTLDRRQYVNTRSARWWSYHSDGSSALTDASVQADPGDGFEIVITEIAFSSGTAAAINIFFEEGSTKILGPWYLEAIAGRGLIWRGEKHVTPSTALTVTTSVANAQSVDVQGYIQPV